MPGRSTARRSGDGRRRIERAEQGPLLQPGRGGWCHRPNATPAQLVESRSMYVAGLSVRRETWSWLAPGRVCGGPVPLSLAGMCSQTAVQLAHQSAKAADSKRAWSERVDTDPGKATARPHPDKGSALQPHKQHRTRRPTSVSAGQVRCGAPRRNRTGDPILTIRAAAHL